MKVYSLIVLFCLLPLHLFAQVLTGRITDVSGEAIPNATLYIREVALGITADDNGEFQASLKKGSYTCDFSSLGYERKTLPLTIDKAETHLAVEMEKKVYALKEVIVSANREDPAYAIMRKAIGMAPFYLHQIEKYESSIYVKGSVKVEKIPRLMTFGSNGKKLKSLTNKLFLIESQNEVSFTSPNRYEQKVLAFSSTLPTDLVCRTGHVCHDCQHIRPERFRQDISFSRGSLLILQVCVGWYKHGGRSYDQQNTCTT